MIALTLSWFGRMPFFETSNSNIFTSLSPKWHVDGFSVRFADRIQLNTFCNVIKSSSKDLLTTMTSSRYITASFHFRSLNTLSANFGKVTGALARPRLVRLNSNTPSLTIKAVLCLSSFFNGHSSILNLNQVY